MDPVSKATQQMGVFLCVPCLVVLKRNPNKKTSGLRSPILQTTHRFVGSDGPIPSTAGALRPARGLPDLHDDLESIRPKPTWSPGHKRHVQGVSRFFIYCFAGIVETIMGVMYLMYLRASVAF